jgi:hypothetical protein
MRGGDGYCKFFSSVQILERVHETWFPDNLGKWGIAALFRVIGGEFDGMYVAFTEFDEQSERFLFDRGYIGSVVAHQILNPTSTFSIADTDSCGKTWLDLVT